MWISRKRFNELMRKAYEEGYNQGFKHGQNQAMKMVLHLREVLDSQPVGIPGMLGEQIEQILREKGDVD